MATDSGIHAWRIQWIEEPGGLQSIGSQRVRHDSVTKLSLLLLSSLENTVCECMLSCSVVSDFLRPFGL